MGELAPNMQVNECPTTSGQLSNVKYVESEAGFLSLGLKLRIFRLVELFIYFKSSIGARSAMADRGYKTSHL